MSQTCITHAHTHAARISWSIFGAVFALIVPGSASPRPSSNCITPTPCAPCPLARRETRVGVHVALTSCLTIAFFAIFVFALVEYFLAFAFLAFLARFFAFAFFARKGLIPSSPISRVPNPFPGRLQHSPYRRLAIFGGIGACCCCCPHGVCICSHTYDKYIYMYMFTFI